MKWNGFQLQFITLAEVAYNLHSSKSQYKKKLEYIQSKSLKLFAHNSHRWN